MAIVSAEGPSASRHPTMNMRRSGWPLLSNPYKSSECTSTGFLSSADPGRPQIERRLADSRLASRRAGGHVLHTHTQRVIDQHRETEGLMIFRRARKHGV